MSLLFKHNLRFYLKFWWYYSFSCIFTRYSANKRHCWLSLTFINLKVIFGNNGDFFFDVYQAYLGNKIFKRLYDLIPLFVQNLCIRFKTGVFLGFCQCCVHVYVLSHSWSWMDLWNPKPLVYASTPIINKTKNMIRLPRYWEYCSSYQLNSESFSKLYALF